MSRHHPAHAGAWTALALALAAAFALSACLAETEEVQTATGTTETWTTIQATLSTNCTCHQSPPGGGNGNVSYRAQDYSAIYDVTSINLSATYKIVAPGNAAGSTLYLVPSGVVAPPSGDMTLSAANVARIQSWIDAGALEK